MKTELPTVAVVGGGLAGLAAAVALSERECQVELFEGKRRLGGRAGSFQDPETGELVDHCQHISMGCCTNLADLCMRTRLSAMFREDHELYFFGIDGQMYTIRAVRWLPPPLHLALSLFGLRHLTFRERWAIASSLVQLARGKIDADGDAITFGDWLRTRGQSNRAIKQFWSVILVSALAEQIDRVSLTAGRKVLLDGFMSSSTGHILQVPQASLADIYGTRLSDWLTRRNVKIHLGRSLRTLQTRHDEVIAAEFDDGQRLEFDYFVNALPWRRVRQVLPPDANQFIPEIDSLTGIVSSSITAVHLWFDRVITELPHAVLLGRLSQWIFNRGRHVVTGVGNRDSHYYQVVVSASQSLLQRRHDDIVTEVCNDLAEIWPTAKNATLCHWRIVTQREAVFSMDPDVERLRPQQQTGYRNLFLAGDWTRTGWPATMEGAVRSGYLAAEGLLATLGRSESIVVKDLPRGWLAKWLVVS